MRLSTPWYEHVRIGTKTVEVRLNRGGASQLAIGDIVTFCDLERLNPFDMRITAIVWYASTCQMLAQEGLESVLPGIKSEQEAISIYRRFYSQQSEAACGILAIHLAATVAA